MTRAAFRTGEDGRLALVGSRCAGCGAIEFPGRPVCPRCGAEGTTEAAVGRTGRIRASAVVHHAPIGFTAPYVVALVELAEGPVVFCPITGCPPDDAVVVAGTAVELVVTPAREGGAPVFQFRPITAERSTGCRATSPES